MISTTMLIKQVNKNISDAFIGKGFDNWGRFLIRYTPQGTVVKQIKGIPFKKEDLAQVEAHFNVQH